MRRTSPSRLRTPVGSSRLLPALWFLLFSVLAGVCFWHGLGGGESSVSQQQAGQPVQQVTHPAEPKTAPIQDVRVGMRTAGKNPLREQVDPDAPEPDPVTWRHLVLRMTKKGGGLLHINLLRELLWIEAVGAVEGESFVLELPEMGAVGDAFVVSIGPCPPIQSGPGNVVTGTFHHEADPGQKILRVKFSNGAVIEGVTDNHPFYSVDRRDYVAIGEMGEGDFVKANGGATRIITIESRFARAGEMLYNLETHNEHVYQVTIAGILVHNSCVNKGGRFSALDAIKKPGEVVHHMPQNAARVVSRGKGPGLGMTIDDHALTRTFSGRGRITNAADANLTPMQRLELDIADIRSLFGNKYEEGIQEMLDYARTLPEFQ